MEVWIRRRSVYFILVYLVLMIGVGAILYSRYETLTRNYTDNHIHDFDQQIQSYQLMQQKMMDNYYGMFLDSPQISNIMYEAAQGDSVMQEVLRHELYGRTKEVFVSLKEFDTRLLFFHLPGQIAFLRVHEPEKFGDCITIPRPSVVKAQHEQKKITAFETGKFFDGFRTIYPLFYQGVFSGTVEIAYPFLALKKQAILQKPGAYTFLVKRSIQQSKSKTADIVKQYQDSPFGGVYFEDKESALDKDLTGFTKSELKSLLDQNRENIKEAINQEKLQGIKLRYNDKYALIVLKPVKEISGNQAAYMVEITPNHTFFAEQFNQLIELLIAIALLLALLMWYVYRYNRSTILLNQYKNAMDESLIISKTDPMGIITYVNHRFTQINGYTEEELIGKPHSIIRHPDTPDSVFKEMFRAIKQGNIFRCTLQNRSKTGKSYFVNISICPIVDENGRIIEYIGICEDITEIQNSLLKAQEAEHVKSLFIANMSHEIRTPLNGIVGFVQLLSKSVLDSKQRKYLSIVENSIDTLMHIVNDILDFSKIEEGKIEIELIKSNLSIEFNAVFALFVSQAHEKHIEYQLILDPRLNECLKLDIFRLKQVMSNLISNALKFTPEGGKISVHIEVLKDTSKYQLIHFSVRDTGIGIPSEKQSKIFEKFMQADSSTTRKFGGTGLGLSISYAMVALMGDVLDVQSEEGNGSVFSFKLKAVKCSSVKHSAPLLEPERTEGDQTTLSLKVLVAEDYEVNQMLIDELLFSKYGIKADFANNGGEVVQKVGQKNYDLILMDVNMPIMDGIEATRIIRKSHPDLTIIALTANSMEGDREKFIAAGMNDYLTKPLDVGALHEVLTGCIPSKETSIVPAHDPKNLYAFNDALAELKTTLNVSDEMFIRLNDKFFESVHITLEKLKEAIATAHYQEISMQAHSIKGSSSTLRYTLISQMAAAIEEQARNEKEYSYQEAFDQLLSEFNRLEQNYQIWRSEKE